MLEHVYVSPNEYSTVAILWHNLSKVGNKTVVNCSRICSRCPIYKYQTAVKQRDMNYSICAQVVSDLHTTMKSVSDSFAQAEDGQPASRFDKRGYYGG